MLLSSTLCLFRHGVFGLLTLAQALLSAGAPQTRHDFASLSVTSGLVRLGTAPKRPCTYEASVYTTS